ncbi:MAG: hypothetical protein IKN16_12035 [Selenomonadaceae bacterium]|nr:hypothetical protein [Selenomonadaceae bacterium]
MAKKIILLLALILSTAANVEAADDINFDELATTNTEGATEFLSLIRMKDNGALHFVAIDDTIHAVGMVKYSSELCNFYQRRSKDGDFPPLKFLMILPERERGQLDDNLGEWLGNGHIIPVYALFDVKGGQIIFDKPFYSARGITPLHYHSTIQNPVHERLIEIFMTHMPRLHEIIKSKNISLP